MTANKNSALDASGKKKKENHELIIVCFLFQLGKINNFTLKEGGWLLTVNFLLIFIQTQNKEYVIINRNTQV